MSRLYPAAQQNDVNSNFESYMSKLIKKKIDKPRTITRERSSRISNPIQINRLSAPKSIVVPYIKTDEKMLHLSDEELVHKEVINNKMAQVEVTVRTVSARNRSRSNSISAERSREPWAKLLQHRKSNEALVAHNYDYGLGTIHFLSKELKHKLQTSCPGDPSLQQIVNDIQHTLYRINPSISTKSEDDDFILPKDQYGETNLNSKLKRENGDKGLKAVKVDQSMQTINIGDAEKHIEKLYEYEPYRMENTIKELESTVNKFQADKEELEAQLQIEKETVQKLKHDMEEQLEEKNGQSARMIKQLREEREALEKQLQENQKEASKVDIQELNNLIQKLRSDNANIEYDNMSLKHEITIMKLEKEKTAFLLESRDKQIKSLKNEIEAIQSLVCSQLFDLKTSCYSPAISRSSIESKNWKSNMKVAKFKPIHDIYMNKMKSCYTSYAPETPSSTIINGNGLSKKDTSTTFKTDYQDEFPQRDVPVSTLSSVQQTLKKIDNAKMIPSDFTLVSETQEMLKDDLETNIKEMFEELKRQALVVTLSSPPSDHLQETRSADTHIS